MAKILVMDDDASVRELCAVVLRGEGFNVVQAADALSGIRAAQFEKPDLILLDWMMPEVDGLDALRQLKSSEETAPIPVVMLTALDGLADIALATMGGAESYVTKPFEPADLASLVRRFLDSPAA